MLAREFDGAYTFMAAAPVAMAAPECRISFNASRRVVLMYEVTNFKFQVAVASRTTGN
jgi:hypothetical protein